MLGVAVGDALGARLEFAPLTYKARLIDGMSPDKGYWLTKQANSSAPFFKFLLQAGQWTDDTSMGLCLADSLLWCGELDPCDQMIRYLNWWGCGYNNAFGYDAQRPTKHSVGLGGNIAAALT